ncbi:MAG TPA: restriction endonuclease subunit S [Streptosporangiaceae bacterium]|nr:restriction endonuclease subunit S [Streptosporangiaceae bacterium]
MSDLPQVWEQIALGDLCDEVAGSIVPSDATMYELYSVPAFPSGQPEIIRGLKIGSAKRPVETNDVLLCKINPRINRVWMVHPNSYHPQIASTEFMPLRLPNEFEGTARYLMWYLRSPQFRAWIELNAEGATGSHTRAKSKQILRQLIPIAPEAEQVRIVAAIEEQVSRLGAAVATLERARGNIKRMRAAVLQAAVAGKLVSGSQRPWDKRLLPTLGTVDRGRSRHRPRNAPELYGGPYPFIQTGEVASAAPWITSYSQTYNEKGLGQSRLWPSGTLCITIAANIAKTGILTFDACFPDSVVGFVAADGAIATRWIELVLRQMQDKLEQLAPATAQRNINLAILGALEIPYPELHYQALVIEEYDRQMSLITSLEAAVDVAIRKSARLHSSILADAFSGELAPQDVDDEPASGLLQRIAAERASSSSGHRPTRGRKPRVLQEEVTE